MFAYAAPGYYSHPKHVYIYIFLISLYAQLIVPMDAMRHKLNSSTKWREIENTYNFFFNAIKPPTSFYDMSKPLNCDLLFLASIYVHAAETCRLKSIFGQMFYTYKQHLGVFTHS